MSAQRRLDYSEIVRLWQRQHTVDEIAGLMSANRDSIRLILNRLGFYAKVRIDHSVVVQLAKEGLTKDEIAVKLGACRTTIGRILNQAGFWERPRVSVQEIRDVISRYRLGQTGPEIAEQLGIDQSRVYWILKKKGIRTRKGGPDRKYHLHQHAFDHAERDPEAAYWVGFMMADGCVVTSRGKWNISLSLSKRDRSHVIKFRKFLKTDYPTRQRKPNRGYSRDTVMVTLTVASRQLVESLARYGVVPRKSKTAEVKLLHNNIHFWRGMIDGDGFVTVKPNGLPIVGLTSGSKKIMEQFADFLEILLDGERRHICQGKFSWHLQLTGSRALRLIQSLWIVNHPCLHRKKKTVQQANKWKSSFRDWTGWTPEKVLDIRKKYGTLKAADQALGFPVGTLASVLYRKNKTRPLI